MASECMREARAIALETNSVADLGKINHMDGHILIKEGNDPREKFNEAMATFESLGRTQDVAEVAEDLSAYIASTRRE